MRKDILRLKILEQEEMEKTIKMQPKDLVLNFEAFRDFSGMILDKAATSIENGCALGVVRIMLMLAVFPKALENTVRDASSGVYHYFPGKHANDVIKYFQQAYVSAADNEIRTIITKVLFSGEFTEKDRGKMFDFYYFNPGNEFEPLKNWLRLEATNIIESDRYDAFIESHNPSNSESLQFP